MSQPPSKQAPAVRFLEVSEDQAGQRLDNFLLSRLKGVPKSRIYRSLRKGEVRVNKGRTKAEYRLQQGDMVRIPPIRVAERETPLTPGAALQQLLNDSVVYEDERVLVINKPSGLAVHGGSGINLGLIEALRGTRAEQHYLELVHRLDRGTSGCLMIAKKRSALRHLQNEFRHGRVVKVYQALVAGQWQKGRSRVNAPLQRDELKSGDRIVRVDKNGKAAATNFRVLRRFANATLVEATLETGRTHQIRVHAQFSGNPLAGDEKYGDDLFNQSMKSQGLKRMFLHAVRLEFRLQDESRVVAEAPLPAELQQLLEVL